MVRHQKQSPVHVRCQWGESWRPPRSLYVAVHVKLYQALWAQDKYAFVPSNLILIFFWLDCFKCVTSSRRTSRPWRVSLCSALSWRPNRRSRCNSSSTTKRRSISFLKPTMSKQQRGTVLHASPLNGRIPWQKRKISLINLSSVFPNRWIDSFKEATVL